MIKKIFVFLFISLVSINLSANEPLLDSAESNYAASNFETAVQHYQSILKKGLSSPDIYYNLGNCYFRNGELGNAILYYEKALKMDPSHKNSAFNLTLAKTKRIDKFDEVPQFSFDVVLIGLNKYISHNYASILGSLLIVIAALGFIYAKKQKIKKLINPARIVAIVGLIITCIAWRQQSAVNDYKTGVVVVKSSNIFSEPNPNSTLLFEIHEGTKVEILSASGNWLNVKAPNNSVGFIEKLNLREI